MTAAYDNYAGLAFHALSWSIPLVGLWVADVQLTNVATIPTTGILTHGDLAMQGAVYRQATFGGITSARLAGGFGGWSNVIRERGYQSAFGVNLSTVLGDAARDVGERVNIQTDVILGNFWARPLGPAGRTLRAAAGSSWWVDPAGVVQVGPRPSDRILSSWQAIDWDGPSGVMTIASENPGDWTPGRTFSSPTVTQQTIAAVRHVVAGDGRARLRVVVS